jgi:ADP-ribosylglycohydrolase
MLGALAGDFIGSPYEVRPIKTTEFPLFRDDCCFTDDSVLTVAQAECLLTGADWAETLRRYFNSYRNAGYGWMFILWARSQDREAYGSWGNGSAMRVSPVGWAFATLAEVLEGAEQSAAVTHNHPEGIKGAQATAAAIFLARTGADREEIRAYVRSTFGYPLDRSLDEIRPEYRFDASCQGTVPVALQAVFESENFEHAIRLAVSMGGDSDTLACITGGVAEALYGGVPPSISEHIFQALDAPLAKVTRQFRERFACP